MRVWFPHPPSEQAARRLQTAAEGTQIAFGEERPEGYEALIEGRPREEALEGQMGLRAVIVPFAGVPEGTLQLMRRYPHIALYNLHHNAGDTAEVALALLLAAAKAVVPYDQRLRRNDWGPRYAPSGVSSLAGKTALILGYGNIGKRVARALTAIDMRVLATRRTAREEIEEGGAHVFPAERLPELLPRSDVLVIALPETAETNGLLGARELALMPAGATLVNVGRGRIVEEGALFDALRRGHLHSAGLDVWYTYPQSGEEGSTAPSAYPFHELENVVMSPHRGGASMDTETHRMDALAHLLNALMRRDDMLNRVNLETGY